MRTRIVKVAERPEKTDNGAVDVYVTFLETIGGSTSSHS